jgi:hypothetical protein
VKPLALDVVRARAFVRRATGLDAPLGDVAAALERFGYAQIDPINVCGRMHDLVLRNRVGGYAEGDLMRHLHPAEGPRRAIEHFLPRQGILAAFPVEAWPMLAPHARFRARSERGFSGRLDAAERRLARRVLAEVEARGPLVAEDIEHRARAVTGWGTEARAVKVLMEKLFVHGELLIGARRGFRRVYDLPHRVLPPEIAARPAATLAECRRWSVLQRLKQRRLVRLGREEHALVSDAVRPVAVPDCPPLWCLREDEALFDAAGAHAPPCPRPRLLAPLDPLIYDRTVTARLWGYDYTWEVYTPPAKRVRGYYALPVLVGTEIVGHVDPKADRASGRLRVVGRKLRRGHSSVAAVRELASFLGLGS